MKKRLVIGNWKLYIESPKEAKTYATALRTKLKRVKGVTVWLAPTFTLIPQLVAAFKDTDVRVGAQSVSTSTTGAHTGDVSVRALREVGATFVIIGHSERREAGVTDEEVRGTLKGVVEAGLIGVLCVGEKSREESGAYVEIIANQLQTALRDFPRAMAKKLVVVYEPVWAIGKSAEGAVTPAESKEMQLFIRKILVDILGREYGLLVPILYGAAVEASNARALITDGGVAGFISGHASSDVESFMGIIKALQ